MPISRDTMTCDACRHGEHENCEEDGCFCPVCWDTEDRGCDFADSGEKAALVLAAVKA
ncbi:MAG: hypothetical protein ACHQC8_02670 [Solirubrobacterales bacterium]